MSVAWPLFSDYAYPSMLPKPKKGSRGAGVRFEQTVFKVFKEKLPYFVEHIPFRFDHSIYIPDGLALVGDAFLLIEVKLTHTARAYYQLQLYSKVIETAFARPTRLLEVCKYYAPEVKFPEPFLVVQDLESFLASNARVGCLFWGH